MFSDHKSVVKKYQHLNETVLEASIFDEEALAQMKSVARLKLLHIGLSIVQSVFKHLSALEGGQRAFKTKTKIIEIVLKESANFRALLVKNVQMPKNQLHDTAKDVKKAIIVVIESVKAACLESEDVEHACRDLFLTLLK